MVLGGVQDVVDDAVGGVQDTADDVGGGAVDLGEWAYDGATGVGGSDAYETADDFGAFGWLPGGADPDLSVGAPTAVYGLLTGEMDLPILSDFGLGGVLGGGGQNGQNGDQGQDGASGLQQYLVPAGVVVVGIAAMLLWGDR